MTNILAVITMLMTMSLGLGYLFAWLITTWRLKWRHIGKSLVVLLPETPGTEATFIRARLKDGKLDVDSRNHDAKRGDQDRLLPQGRAAYQAKGAFTGPLHIMTTYGANLVAPSKLEAAETIEKVAVADWVANHKRLPKKEEAAEGGAFANELLKAFADAAKRAQRFLVWDCLAYFKACDENDMQDFLNAAGGTKDPWYARAAFIGVVIVGGLLLLVLAVLMLKILPALGGVAGA